MKSLKIIFADDHRIMREGVKMLMSNQDLYEVEFIEAANGQEAVDLYRSQDAVDVVLLDIRMPGKDGLSACEEILEFDANARIIFLSMQDEEHTIGRALQSGAKGYILKDAGITEIMNAINNVLKGGEYISPGTLSKLSGNHPFPKSDQGQKKMMLVKEELTKRERDVLELISMEKTSQEIAKQLELSKRTVEKHRYKLMTKLGAKSTVGLIKNAIRNGWISTEERYLPSTR